MKLNYMRFLRRKKVLLSASFILALFFVLNSNSLHAATFTSVVPGDFNVSTTWGTGNPTPTPSASDDISVTAGTTVTLSSNTTIHSITIDQGGVLDNAGFPLSLAFASVNVVFTINGEYTGDGPTNVLNGANCKLSGTGLISTMGDWTFGWNNASILSGTDLTISNSNFIFLGSCIFSCNPSASITLVNGSITFNTTSSNNGIIILNNGSFFLNDGSYFRNYGTITVGGDIIANNTNTKFYNASASILNIEGALLPTSGDLWTAFGSNNTNTVNYNGAGNQIVKTPGLSGNPYYNLKCSNKGVKTLSGNILIKNNFTIQDTAQLDVSPDGGTTSYNIDLKGNWYDTSTATQPFIPRNSKVTFSDTAAQTITAWPVSGGETFNNLIINNSSISGVSLIKGNIKVSDTLTLSDGLVNTGTDTLWLSNTDTAAIQKYSDTTYVTGYLRRSISSTTSGSYDFPVGNANTYSLANIKFFDSNTVGSITADFNNPSGGTALTSLTDANDAVYASLLNCGGLASGIGNVNAGVWNIHSEKGSAIYDLSLYGRHYDNQGSMYQSIVKRKDFSSPWSFGGTYLTANLKPDTLIAKRTCLTDFAEFAIAGSNTNTPLNTIPLSFQSQDTMICGSKCIAFSSKNNFSATAWRWSRSISAFAGGADTALQNPAGICFNSNGNYDVRLIASTACTADTLKRNAYIKVNPIPTTVITSPDSICSGASLSISASSPVSGTTFLWNTGESAESIHPSPLSNTSYSVIAFTSFCSDTAYTTIAVTTTPTASINASTTAICSGESVSLTAKGAAEAYLWNTGATGTSTTASPLLPIRYSLKLSNGKCSDTDSTFINVTTTPTATITTGETSICSGKRIILSAASAIPEVNYLWNNATTSKSINAIPLTNTTYSVVLSNGICKDTANISITVTTSPTLTLTSNRTIVCAGESVTLSATGAGDYLWSTGESGTSVTASPLLPIRYPLFTVHYSLKLSNGSCSDIDSILITVVPMPTASISGSLTLCTGSSTGLTASAGGETYLWSTGETTSSITKTPLSNTSYSVTVSNGHGLCTDTTSRNITLITPVPADAGPDITIATGIDTVLSANTGTAWNWYPKVRMDCSTCQNPIVAPFQTTNYTVTVTDINGCLSSDSVRVYVIPCAELFVPKAFSPNNDGNNDILYIRGTDCIDRINTFTIFNRWGEKVFETFDIKAGWDGNQTKQTIPNEVFIYYLDALSINGDAISKTGNVTLMR